MWVSENGGEGEWRRLESGLNHEHIYSLTSRTIDGTTTIFAGTAPAALYRSDDLGETWTDVASLREVPGSDRWTFIPPPHHPHVKSVVFHPMEPETYFVLVEQGALLKTVDDGKSFSELDSYSSPDDRQWKGVHRLLIHPTEPDLMYLATGEGLFRTRDGGISFDNIHHRGLRMGYPEFLFLDPADHKTVLMAGVASKPDRMVQGRDRRFNDPAVDRSGRQLVRTQCRVSKSRDRRVRSHEHASLVWWDDAGDRHCHRRTIRNR